MQANTKQEPPSNKRGFQSHISPRNCLIPKEDIAIEQQMLAIIDILKQYQNFLLKSDITIYTDHKNLLADQIQEYNPTIVYIKGHKNIEADVLSCLTMTDKIDQLAVMLNHPPMDPFNPLLNKYPLNLEQISLYQKTDTVLQDTSHNRKRIYYRKHIWTIIVCVSTPKIFSKNALLFPSSYSTLQFVGCTVFQVLHE